MNKKQKFISPKLRMALLVLIAIVATIGLFDAMYLTVTHYTQALVPCNFTSGCETVLQSSYSEIFGFPIAALGVVFYIVVLSAAIFFLLHKIFHWWLLVWSMIGLLSTLYLLYIQAFVLHAFCQYCLLSATTSTLIFVLVSMLYFTNNKLSEKKQ